MRHARRGGSPTGGGDGGESAVFRVSFRPPVKPFTSPALYDADTLRFLFAGGDANGDAQYSYLGELSLPY